MKISHELLATDLQGYYDQTAVLRDRFSIKGKVPAVAAHIVIGMEVDSAYLKDMTGFGKYRLAGAKESLKQAGLITIARPRRDALIYKPADVLRWAASDAATEWVEAAGLPDFGIFKEELVIARAALERFSDDVNEAFFSENW